MEINEQNFENGILITPEMEMETQNTIKTEPNENIINEQSGGESRYINFSQALANLKIGEILTRKALVGKMIKMESNQFVLWSNNLFNKPTYNFTNEDIMAEDWEVIDPDDIKVFNLSVNQLKDLGVSETDIDKLNVLKNTPSLPEHLTNLLKDKDIKLDISSILENVKIVNTLPSYETPKIPFIKN
ncbi:hypothetical protein [Desulfosporosinus youngiae]|uniref:Uncharacterized protein n=1 Tax=Desulfosporosinus youngiae DSM 17734 TaxID=768710 RepID=H5Y591_9FIRM|nr:hypothetical protein [Desulfosporosinus youngiae]EHQ90195.1 hypothetical protein DesyoDRAFT_3161 [Desulfosporosinus youngiae DSM 17734]